jgi:ABC-type multidrug transport system ATPase subunit
MSLQLLSVTRRFGAQLALDSVSIHVRAGDCYGFIGHNGSGKTTAMRIALGLQRPDAGRVFVDGFDVFRNPREARARMGGLIEQPGFHGHLDGATNLRLLARLGGMSRAQARSESERLLELVGLGQVGAKPVQAFSQGMRQRLGIAQAMLGRPKLVLLDEPTNGLDPQGIAEIRGILRRLVDQEGVSVLLSSHQLHEVSDLCNRIGVLHRGRLLVEARTQDLLASAPGRLEIATSDDAKALELLERDGLRGEKLASGGFALELGSRSSGALARQLVQAGLDLQRFGARAPNLEEIYLRFARGETMTTAAQAPSPAPEPHAKPREQLAARHGIARTARYELSRLFAKRRFALLLAAPAVVGAGAIALEKREALENAARVAAGELASATDVTAFQSTASALQAGLPLLALLVAGIASQALAGELSRGTLRNVLLRPQTRWEVVLGKSLAGLAICVLAYLVLGAAAVGASSLAFGFKDLVELLPNGDEFPLIAASDLWPELRRAVASQTPVLFAYYGLGLLAGAVARTAPGALGFAIALVLGTDLLRGVARSFHFEGWLLAAYAPSPLGDTSYLNYFSERAQGISNAVFRFASHNLAGLDASLAVPLVWLAGAVALSIFLLHRRAMP